MSRSRTGRWLVRASAAVLPGLLYVSPIMGQVAYNGDADPNHPYGGLGSATNTFEVSPGVPFSSFIFENFTVSNTNFTLTDIFGQFIGRVLYGNPTTWTTALWEVRSGVSVGNGGTLIASGTGSATQSATGTSWFASSPEDMYPFFDVAVSGLSVALAPGEYWVGLSPFVQGLQAPAALVGFTTGTNGVNSSLDGKSFYNDNLTYNFADFSQRFGDYSLGIAGTTSTVPEPATMTLLATGLAGMAAARRRKKAAV